LKEPIINRKIRYLYL